MKLFIFIIAIWLFVFYANGQDSISTFTYDEYIEQVMVHHPYAFRANIVRDMGKAEVLQARGAFDPRLIGNVDQKYFEEKQYYSHVYGGLKVPTWYGISFETGYSLNDGIYLNPENRLPDAGLWYAGLRLELGSGLIIDERRATLQKALLQQEGADLQRKILLNELKRDASISYWEWQQAYEKMELTRLVLNNAEQRLEAVKKTAYFGDRPYIDTVEASMNVTSRRLSLITVQRELANAELKLEFYLWSNGFIPLELENVVPEPQMETSINLSVPSLDSLIQQHPFLKLQGLNVAEQKVNLRLKQEYLKPKITLKYNLINEPVYGNPLSEYSTENYTWGATFAYPLPLRQERGALQLAQLKLNDQELKFRATEANLLYTLNAVKNNYYYLQEQLATAMQLTRLNEDLYIAENSIFNLGESSLFMINTRENGWLKAKMDQIELHTQTKVTGSELEYQLMQID